MTCAVEDAANAGDPAALLAIEVYIHRLAGSIGAMSVVAEGLDALVFTGGVGEHSPMVRQRTVERLGFLGAAIDQDRNVDFQVEAGEAHRDGDVSSAESRVRVLVIAAREDLQIAREARTVLGG